MNKLDKRIILAITFVMVLGVSAAELFLGESLNFSIFYTFPIIFCTWFAGNPAGFSASGVSVMLWISIEIYRGTAYPSFLAPVWETMVRLGYFLLIVFLLKALKRRLLLLEEMSLTDPLTGALNSRGFLKAIETQTEMARRAGNPISVAFIDIDEFKKINDTRGHAEGDLFLQEIVRTIKRNIRKYDILARIGGDEFVIFFSLESAGSADKAIRKVFNALKQKTKELQYQGVSFSIGMLTTREIPAELDRLIKTADDLMYTVKHSGKNRIYHKEFRVW